MTHQETGCFHEERWSRLEGMNDWINLTTQDQMFHQLVWSNENCCLCVRVNCSKSKGLTGRVGLGTNLVNLGVFSSSLLTSTAHTFMHNFLFFSFAFSPFILRFGQKGSEGNQWIKQMIWISQVICESWRSGKPPLRWCLGVEKGWKSSSSP